MLPCGGSDGGMILGIMMGVTQGVFTLFVILLPFAMATVCTLTIGLSIRSFVN